MRVVFGAWWLLTGSLLVGQTPPQFGNQSEGVRPRSQASDYATQARNSTAILAAAVVPSQQVKHLFAYDISKTYVVIEVACYPGVQGPVALHNADFTIRLAAKTDPVNPAEAATVAANIQRKTTPAPPGKSVPVYTEANVGYESGTDPYTGRHVHTVYTGAGVGIGGPPVAPYPNSGGYSIDPALLEEQLWRRSLPEGNSAKPVAGYLYFPVSLLKKEKGFYLLGVHGENSDQWELRVPLPR